MFFSYLNSLKYLKPVQIYGRILFFLKRKFINVSIPERLRRRSGELKSRLLIGPNEKFEIAFLHKTKSYPLSEVGWSVKDYKKPPERLWLYNLNYFDWIDKTNSTKSEQKNMYLILDWIEKNRDSRADSWEPYIISKRTVNWINFCNKVVDQEFVECVIESLVLQIRRLLIDIEWHNQANHLLENFKALFVVSAFLYSKKINNMKFLENVLDLSVKNLHQQIQEQFLSDGGHYERSQMYHKQMLNSVKLIEQTCKSFSKVVPDSHDDLKNHVLNLKHLCRYKSKLIEDWLKVMTHPDGMIAQFNDTELAEGLVSDDYEKKKNSPKPMNYLLKDSGYFVRKGSEHYFVMSCKEPSPPFQPGHSHCDIMSYELSLFGSRCIVDTGCGSYKNDEMRRKSRSTWSHNLPCIKKVEQSDIWGAFRIGKRARVLSCSYSCENSVLHIEIKDQFDQVFKREVLFRPGCIKFRDRLMERRVSGDFCSLIHFAPGVMISSYSENKVFIFKTQKAEFKVATEAKTIVEPHNYFPAIGRFVGTEKMILISEHNEAIDYVINY